jgi:hypothetical protein
MIAVQHSSGRLQSRLVDACRRPGGVRRISRALFWALAARLCIPRAIFSSRNSLFFHGAKKSLVILKKKLAPN